VRGYHNRERFLLLASRFLLLARAVVCLQGSGTGLTGIALPRFDEHILRFHGTRGFFKAFSGGIVPRM
jgi:hypothetical protein